MRRFLLTTLLAFLLVSSNYAAEQKRFEGVNKVVFFCEITATDLDPKPFGSECDSARMEASYLLSGRGIDFVDVPNIDQAIELSISDQAIILHFEMRPFLAGFGHAWSNRATFKKYVLDAEVLPERGFAKRWSGLVNLGFALRQSFSTWDELKYGKLREDNREILKAAITMFLNQR